MFDSEQTVHIFGIRHHGPGSAASLVDALEQLQPDIILIEGPPDAESVMPLAAHADMRPPVSLLIYVTDDPKKASFYPLAVFSPEWQAIQFAIRQNIEVRFMDLPQSYLMALQETPETILLTSPDENTLPELTIRFDPLGELAKVAGYSDGERWWEVMVEQRQNSAGIFEAIREGMTALRKAAGPMQEFDQLNLLREAWMRKSIRMAQKEGFPKIAVVCGAWHTPALIDMPPASNDNELLKGLKKVNVTATWIPWTHGRLTLISGYGAGVWSPGWYQHLWECRGDIAATWLTRVAHLLRDQDLTASTAQVIDAVKLARTLASLRDLPLPGLAEFNDAVLTVFCHADIKPMQLIFEKLIVGEDLGTVPAETPMLPIQRDFERQQKSLRMRIDTIDTTLNLDLRKPFHLERSYLLHRLQILDIPWGNKQDTSDKSGTFHEVWRLHWQPELAIRLIEKNVFGNTIYDAATAYSKQIADDFNDLPALTGLVRVVLLADLPDAVSHLVHHLQEKAALTGDVTVLMGSLPPLADVLTYGNVRKTDAKMVSEVVHGIVTRVTVGMPTACASLADDAAKEMFRLMLDFQSALRLLNQPAYHEEWQAVLIRLLHQEGVHGLVKGRSCRILMDSSKLTAADVIHQMRFAISRIELPAQVAAWLEGFLYGSALILLHDNTLLTVIDEWVTALTPDDFEALLPVLRRTFTAFAEPERKEIGRKIKQLDSGTEEPSNHAVELDEARADSVLPVLAALLGIDYTEEKIND